MNGNAPDLIIGSIFCLKKIRKAYADMTNPAKELCYTVFLQRDFGKVMQKREGGQLKADCENMP